MTVLTERDQEILFAYLNSYKEAFEAMNDLLYAIIDRVELTPEEVELANKSEAKYKNMIYHIRKWQPNFKTP
jgi:hypothetical protein